MDEGKFPEYAQNHQRTKKLSNPSSIKRVLRSGETTARTRKRVKRRNRTNKMTVVIIMLKFAV